MMKDVYHLTTTTMKITIHDAKKQTETKDQRAINQRGRIKMRGYRDKGRRAVIKEQNTKDKKEERRERNSNS